MKKLPKKRWFSMWRHFYDREKTARQLTDSMIAWQEKWNWDFMKINPAACYHALDFGAEYEFFDDASKEPELRKPVVVSASDVDRLPSPDVTKGALGDQLQVIHNLRAHFGPDLPMVETVFSPIEIAHRLMPERQSLLELAKSDPQALHKLLQKITDVFRSFVLRALEAGADGVFFATKWASRDSFTWSEYENFGKKYEMPILRALQSRDALIILHVCGSNTYLDRMYEYPVDIFSYDFFAESVPAPEEAIEETGKFVLGGIDPDKIKNNVSQIVDACGRLSTNSKWLAGPSCVLHHDTPDSNIRAVKDALHSWS